jgi:hypothetical protein
MLSEEYVREKYLERRFDPTELSKGRHGNRTNITAGVLRIGPKPTLRKLAHASPHEFATTAAMAKHSWEWL